MREKKKPFWRFGKHYLMLAPFFILFAVFYLYPLAYGLFISTQKWNGVQDPVFVGATNFVTVVNSPYFGTSFLNLIKYVLITMFFGITIAFGLALLVNRFTGAASNVFRSAYFLPTVIPLFLTAAVWRWMLTPDYGFVNRIIVFFGMQSIDWLTNPAYMILAAVLVDVWRSTGFNMIILLAGLNGIPQEYYEAAKVDGANTLQQIVYITIPQLEPVLFLVIVNGFISALQIFDVPWLITQSTYGAYGGPQQGMLFPVMDIMGRAFGALKFGEAAAYAWILLVVVLLITVLQFAVRRRYSDNA
ncbi:MAG TPA: sugar ABC transporter permease [Anaerolineae bacterium]|jgi:multiple sugar transport system permease protein